MGATAQALNGSTTFYKLTKTIPAGIQVHQLIFDHTAVQTITNELTLQGIAGNELFLKSDLGSNAAGISLVPGGLQHINYVDVTDSNAGGGLWLVARDSTPHAAAMYNNTHWVFGSTLFTWTGALSTDWRVPNNWDLGLVPMNAHGAVVADSVRIPGGVTNVPHFTVPHVPPDPEQYDINLLNMTLDVDARLYADGYKFDVTGAFANDGTIYLQGDEAVNIVDPDIYSGTFVYRGNGVIGSSFPLTAPNLFYNLVIENNLSGTPSTFVNAVDMTIYGNLGVAGATLNAGAKAIDLRGDFAMTGGNFTAPGSGKSFTVQGGFAHTAGSFVHNSGKVTFSGNNTVTVSGDTVFQDVASQISSGAKTIKFAQGSNQTITGSLDLAGNAANKLILRSTTDSTSGGGSTSWSLTILNAAPLAGFVDVRDSTAVFPNFPVNPATDIIATNSTDNKNGVTPTNIHWIFFTLNIVTPAPGTVVGPVPTIIGHGVPGHDVTLKDGTGTVIASAKADTNGNFRVVVGKDDASLGTVTKFALDSDPNHPVTNTITPYYGIITGDSSTFSVVVAPTAAQVPVITSPVDQQTIVTSQPVIQGNAKPGSQVFVVAKDQADLYLLSLPPEAYMGQGVVAADGTFSFALTRNLSRGSNYVSVIVDGVSSAIKTFIVNDVYGIVFDSSSNQPLKGASVLMLKADGTMAVKGTDIALTDTNPMVTGADGIYSFLTVNASYKIVITALGYSYPTILSDEKLPAGRKILLGSRGEVFITDGLIHQMDQPLDANPYLFRIEKKSNKTEARIGEVVTYTVSIECLSKTNSVIAPRFVDVIPPGFKYMNGRALLDGVPMPDPTGNRPLTFLPGDFTPGQKKIVRYQLVIGAGVAPGAYDNVATMQYPTGLIISNKTVATVKIVLDPLFDAGTVFGKVFYDWNENGRQDDPQYSYEDRQKVIEGPVPNVSLAMEDGTVVTADENGQFHIPALVPGRHLLRLDERTLPPGAYLTTDKVQVVDVTPGSIIKVNFGVNVDNAQIVGKDAEYFQKELKVDQSTTAPKPRLNVNMFNDNILLHNDTVIEQIEFRLFTNYAPFLVSWQLDVVDADTKKLVRSFKGTRSNINDPVYWDGRDAAGQYLLASHHYAFVLKVQGEHEKWDETKEQPLVLKVMTDADMADRQRQRSAQEKKDEATARTKKYHDFLLALALGDALKTRNIWVKGDTLTLKSAGSDVRQVVVLRNGQVFAEVPVPEHHGLTAQDLAAGQTEEQAIPMEVILPDGDYELEVVTAQEKGPGGWPKAAAGGGAVKQGPAEQAGAMTAGTPEVIEAAPVQTAHYRKPLKVGEDYLMFVAMGDGKVGYNMDRGHIEPVQSNDQYRRGFYDQGKIAYYLKGKIQGKYIVTSSFDTERQAKAALRTFKDNAYYPVYGDNSTLNYDAANTEGPLYLSVDWDKSQAIWGNYAVAFNDTEFANYTRTLYGGKLDYKSVATTDYGEAKTGIAVFHAEVHQRAAHNEFLATGGSLYYFKNNDIVQGTDKVKVEVRDAVTGLVKSALEMKSGVDYSIDPSNGRILFWRPLSMSVDNNQLISNNLLGGDPMYVVADYEYFVHDQLAEGTQGARVTKALGKNVVAGATYVSETQAAGKYQLGGEDVTVHLAKDSTVHAEYAETVAAAQNNFISTDGGITFSDLSGAAGSNGKAYGITQDARLFDRVGLKSYYKWIGDGFSTGGTTSQQGKSMNGMAMTFDMTPVTRLTASRDVQRLITSGNLQTAMQVGGQETTTTLVQLVHDARRLRLTEAFASTQTKGNGTATTQQSNSATAAAEAQYALNEKTDIRLKEQVEVSGTGTTATTLGVDRQLTNKLKGTLEETVGSAGTATRAGVAANVTPKLAVSTDITLAKARTGELSQTVALGSKGQINDKTSLDAMAAVTRGVGTGPQSTVSLGGTTKVNETTSLQALTSVARTTAGTQEGALTLGGSTKIDNTDVKVGVETSQSSDAAKAHQALSLDGSRRDAKGLETTGGVKIDDRPVEGKMTVITAGEKGPMTPDVQVATERSFSVGTTSQEENNTYKISRMKDGRNLETSYARKLADGQTGVSDSNIFGLTGDVNDKVAAQASLEKGKVRNLDGTLTDRTVLSTGLGFVDKDKETGKIILQSSTKAEVRLDKGATDTQQYVFYQAADGKMNEQTTVHGKFDYSVTRDMNTGKAQAGYKEIMLGAAYRPVAMDRVNLFSEYTYKENKGPIDQVTATDIEQTKMHVLTAGAGYELNDKWELIEKLALRIMDEKVAGFEFAKTHTWLSVSRVNYTIDQDWKIGAEYRTLAVQEAKDRKSGFLLEAVHSVNDNVEMGIGYNFTSFVDDLTNLSYTVQGPYLRMTGKLFDQSPAERARARARWIDRRVELYAWKMVKVEFHRKDSPIVLELNQVYQKAQAANKRGHYDEAQQLYKRIIIVTQMMYEEAAQFVRHHIDFEERVFNAFQRAREYFDKGDIWQARKLWEKIVEEASRAVLE